MVYLITRYIISKEVVSLEANNMEEAISLSWDLEGDIVPCKEDYIELKVERLEK